MNYLILIISILLIHLTSEFFKEKNFLLNFSGERHQKFVVKDKIPLCGGFFIFFYFSLLFYEQLQLIFFIFLIFALGIISDLKILVSPKIRFLLQILILFFFIYLIDLNIENTKIILIDRLIANDLYNYFFVLFCILILVNGTNFIDGLNTNVLGYYIIISFFLIQINKDFFLEDFEHWNLWIISLIILFIFNLFNKLFIGDSGSYILSLIYGYLLIEFFNKTEFLSSLFIVILVWYPCFELLFSIIRKFKFNKSPIIADTKHFHQLLYLYIKKKYKLSALKSNVTTAVLINTYNFLSIFLASIYYYNSQYQAMIIVVNIIVYFYLYLNLFKKIFLKNL